MSQIIYLQQQSFCCEKVLREIPGNRAIYSGKWQQEDVIVKKFFGKHGKRRMHREVKGLVRLKKRNVRAPHVLFYGENSVGEWCIITKYICDGNNMQDLWGNTTSSTEKENLLLKVIATLADHHDKKILQKDLHLGNFLLAQNEVFTLDPAQIKFSVASLKRRECLHNLAILAAAYHQFPAHYFLHHYMKHRAWRLSEKESKYFVQKLQKISQKRIEKILKKYLRQNTRHHQVTSAHTHAIVDKALCTQQEILPLCEQIKSLCSTQRNSYMNFKEHSLRITRYTEDGEAKRNWCNTHHLQLLGFYFPPPLAYIKNQESSFVISQNVAYEKLSDLLQQQQTDVCENTISKIMSFLEFMKSKQVIHNDLFHSIVTSDEKVFLLNTEQVVFYPKNYDDMYDNMYDTFRSYFI